MEYRIKVTIITGPCVDGTQAGKKAIRWVKYLPGPANSQVKGVVQTRESIHEATVFDTWGEAEAVRMLYFPTNSRIVQKG